MTALCAMTMWSCSDSDNEPEPAPTPNPVGGSTTPEEQVVTLPESIVDSTVTKSISGLFDAEYNSDGTIKKATYQGYNVKFAYAGRAGSTTWNLPIGVTLESRDETYGSFMINEVSEIEYNEKGFVTTYNKVYKGGQGDDISVLVNNEVGIQYDSNGRVEIIFNESEMNQGYSTGLDRITFSYSNGCLTRVEKVEYTTINYGGQPNTSMNTSWMDYGYTTRLENRYNVFTVQMCERLDLVQTVLAIAGFLGNASAMLPEKMDGIRYNGGEDDCTLSYEFDSEKHIKKIIKTHADGFWEEFDYSYDRLN